MKNNGRRAASRNRLEILSKLKPGRPSSRTELARATGLSAATVSRITRDLVRGRVLTEVPRPRAAAGLPAGADPGPAKAGRPTRGLEINGRSGTVLGISLLAPAARIAILNLRGDLVKEVRQPVAWHRGVGGILEPLRRAVRSLARGPARLSGVGVALPGMWERDAGISTQYPRVPEWKNVPIRKLLEEWIRAPASLIGYAPATAVAEHAHRGDPANLLSVEVAENIAMGAIVNGAVVEGVSGNAGELGHITVDAAGPVCYCGNRGCLETLATCAAVEDEIRSSDAAGDLFPNPRSMTYEDVVRRAQEGDAFSARLLGRAARTLGIGLAAALNLFSPEVLVLSGRFFEAGDLVLGPLQLSIKDHTLPSSLKRLTIDRSKLGPLAAAFGAGLVAIKGAVQRL